MDAKEHLYYGLGIVAFAAAKADGEIQVTEQKELHDLVHEWSEKYSRDFDVTEIIFSVLKNSKPGFNEGFEDGMKYIKLGSNHLDEQTKEHFIYLIQDIAHAFPPVTHAEEEIIKRFKEAMHELK